MMELTHRQLVSAIVALSMPSSSVYEPYLYNHGYEINALELSVVDSRGERFMPDIHLVKMDSNRSLLVDCKTGPVTDDGRQLRCYLTVRGTDVVSAGRLTLSDPRSHSSDSLLFITGAAEPSVNQELTNILNSGFTVVCGFGAFRVSAEVIELYHDELTDQQISSSGSDGWKVHLADLPLELLPYEVSSPGYELAVVVLQTLGRFNAIGQRCFSLDDLCVDSHPYWAYLGDQQDIVRRRIQRMMVNLRKTALKDWVRKRPHTGPPEDEWCFIRQPSVRKSSLEAFARRGNRYVTLLRDGINPRPQDFDDVDQTLLPFPS